MSMNSHVYPNPHVSLYVGSKETSWEELAWEPPCNGISSSTKFSLNSCSHSGRNLRITSHRFPRSIGVSFSFEMLGDFVGLGFHKFPVLSSTNSDTGTGEMSLLSASSLSRTDISTTEGEDGEDEEDDEQWLSCLEGVFEVDEDPEDELDKPGTTNRNEASPYCKLSESRFFWDVVFDRWSIHKRYPCSSQRLSERQYCWRVIEDFHCQEDIQLFDLHNCLFLRLHFTIGGYDYRRTTTISSMYPISALLKSLLLIMCIDDPESTTNSHSSGFNVDAGRHLFSESEKNVALWCSFSFNTFLANFHASSRAPSSCQSVSSYERCSNFGALGPPSCSSPG